MSKVFILFDGVDRHTILNNTKLSFKLTSFLFITFWLLTACQPVEISPPYPQSTKIREIVFDWSSHISLARGSDNWPITWADDDHQYTSWGDGGGFGGSNSKGRVSLGR